MSGASGSREKAALALVLSTGLLLGACGEEEDEIVVRPGEQSEAFCEALCTRGNECGGRDIDLCRHDCEADTQSLEDIRADGIQIIVDCIMGLSCGRFFTDEAFDACWDRGVQGTKPNETTRSFCFAYSTRYFECGYTYSTEECEGDWAFFSKRYLDRKLECTKLECSEFLACNEAVSGGS